MNQFFPLYFCRDFNIMQSNIQFWEQLSVFILYIFVLIKPISSQGLSCYKCMTTNPNDDGCQDPFSSLINQIQTNCQVHGDISFIIFLFSLYLNDRFFLLQPMSIY